MKPAQPQEPSQETGDNQVIALLFAERVLFDQVTRRYTLVGIFDIMRLGKQEPSWCVFVSVCGETMFAPNGTIYIELTISKDGEAIFTADSTTARLGNSLETMQVIQFAIPIPLIGISQGEYTITLVMNEKKMATRTMKVEESS